MLLSQSFSGFYYYDYITNDAFYKIILFNNKMWTQTQLKTNIIDNLQSKQNEHCVCAIRREDNQSFNVNKKKIKKLLLYERYVISK